MLEHLALIGISICHLSFFGVYDQVLFLLIGPWWRKAEEHRHLATSDEFWCWSYERGTLVLLLLLLQTINIVQSPMRVRQRIEAEWPEHLNSGDLLSRAPTEPAIVVQVDPQEGLKCKSEIVSYIVHFMIHCSPTRPSHVSSSTLIQTRLRPAQCIRHLQAGASILLLTLIAERFLLDNCIIPQEFFFGRDKESVGE